MKIALSGATGFVGRNLSNTLKRSGHHVLSLKRSDFNRGVIHLSKVLAGCDAVFNLAGEPINRRWTRRYKQRIRASRIETTNLLVSAMERMELRPTSFISTSAIGAFQGDAEYSETDPPNANDNDFLGLLSQEWEAAALKADQLGIRTLIFRFALVLGHDGGLLKQLLLPFRLGLGGPIGKGRQGFSWVHIDDLVDAYLFALKSPEMKGVFHLSAPTPVDNLAFTRTLGSVLHRPALLPVPQLMLKLIFGEGAGVMTSGQRVVSKRLPEAGFAFRYDNLELALVDLVERDHKTGSCFSLSESGN
jgi:uncharacterized protein (TIGR01777 family)